MALRARTRPKGAGALACLMVALLAGPALAQTTCPGQTQLDMTQCAQARFYQADAQLNAAWGQAKARYDGFGAGAVLLDAQRKWIAFRDAACQAESAPYAGGSIQPLVHFDCLTRLTHQRTTDLFALMQN